jgi:hypothetical protein
MKELSIYKENDEFVIERTNEFNHTTKRVFASVDGLFEGLEAYKDIMDQYKLDVSSELWAMVINYISTGEKPSRGGKREGAGRPSLGTTKKVSITLPDEVWDMIDTKKENMTLSAYLRFLIMQKFRD